LKKEEVLEFTGEEIEYYNIIREVDIMVIFLTINYPQVSQEQRDMI